MFPRSPAPAGLLENTLILPNGQDYGERLHYGFLYEVKRGFRRVESQILNASSTGFSNIRLCTFDEPIKMDILKLKKVVKKVT